MHAKPASPWTWKELSIYAAKAVVVNWVVTYLVCLSVQNRAELAHLKASAATVAFLVAWIVFILVRNGRTWADVQTATCLALNTNYVAIVPKPEPFPFSSLLRESITFALLDGVGVALLFRFAAWCWSRWRGRSAKIKQVQHSPTAELSPTPDGTWT